MHCITDACKEVLKLTKHDVYNRRVETNRILTSDANFILYRFPRYYCCVADCFRPISSIVLFPKSTVVPAQCFGHYNRSFARLLLTYLLIATFVPIPAVYHLSLLLVSTLCRCAAA